MCHELLIGNLPISFGRWSIAALKETIEEQEVKTEKREDDVLARFWGVAVGR